MNNEVMDTHPKEQFVFHAAGLGGRGSASYIDAVAFRDKDTTAWTANGRTPLDQRHYALLNWRSDVVVIVTDAGALVQHARYNDSGSPWGVPAGDVNGDGIVNTTDTGILLGAIGGAYVARYDLNLDGTVDAADHTIANNNLGDTLGHNALSLNPSSDVRGGHRLGYTGHTHADFNNALIVMRNRWYSGDLGRFVSRDPMGFVDGANVYAYARGNGVTGRDPMGYHSESIGLPFEPTFDCNVIADEGPTHFPKVPDHKNPNAIRITITMHCEDLDLDCYHDKLSVCLTTRSLCYDEINNGVYQDLNEACWEACESIDCLSVPLEEQESCLNDKHLCMLGCWAYQSMTTGLRGLEIATRLAFCALQYEDCERTAEVDCCVKWATKTIYHVPSGCGD